LQHDSANPVPNLQIENEHFCVCRYPISTWLDRRGTAPRRLLIMAHQSSVSALPNFLPLATSVRGRALGSIIARTFGRFALHALAVSLLTLSAAVPGFAATDTVTSLADDGSSGTLRSVIAAAAPGDTINFSVSGTITLTSGTLALSQN
jgi:hypothetical protein